MAVSCPKSRPGRMLTLLMRVIERTLGESGLRLADLDAVAATSGPGLIGGVMVGMMTGKALALAAGKPFLPINHLEGHALSPRLAAGLPIPVSAAAGQRRPLSVPGSDRPWCVSPSRVND